VAEAVAAALFVAWLAATLAVSIRSPRTAGPVRRADVLRLVPDWFFFAPNPGTSDYHLLARVRRPDGSTSSFSEMAPVTTAWRRCVWHPEKRFLKTVFDCGQALMKLEGDARSGVEYTLAYLTLLKLVTSRIDTASSAAVQFMLLRTNPYLPQPELLARSRFHPLSR
jgi:hypothetical protein